MDKKSTSSSTKTVKQNLDESRTIKTREFQTIDEPQTNISCESRALRKAKVYKNILEDRIPEKQG